MAAMKSIRLTHTFVKTVTRPGRYGDGRGGLGLSLLVKKTAAGGLSKTWSQRLRIGRKIATMGFGSFPVVTLAYARKRALDNARRVNQGEDILKPPPIIPTVDEAFDIVIEQRRPSWKGEYTEACWGLTKRYCRPISSKPVSEVKQKDVIDVLAPIWQKKPKMAREVRSNLSTVMTWAINREYRASNPATSAAVKELGKQPPGRHHASLAQDQLGSALAKIRDADAWWAVRYCLIFTVFTGVRSGEARRATWDEINWEDLTWTIPGARMKNSIDHKIPLCGQTIEILLHAREILLHGRDQNTRCEGVIFPPQRGGHHIAASNALRPHAQDRDTRLPPREQGEFQKLGRGTRTLHPATRRRNGPSSQTGREDRADLYDLRLLRRTPTGHAGMGRFSDQDHGADHRR